MSSLSSSQKRHRASDSFDSSSNKKVKNRGSIEPQIVASPNPTQRGAFHSPMPASRGGGNNNKKQGVVGGGTSTNHQLESSAEKRPPRLAASGSKFSGGNGGTTVHSSGGEGSRISGSGSSAKRMDRKEMLDSNIHSQDIVQPIVAPFWKWLTLILLLSNLLLGAVCVHLKEQLDSTVTDYIASSSRVRELELDIDYWESQWTRLQERVNEAEERCSRRT